MSVWILAELEGSLPTGLTFELLTAGRMLADGLGQPLGAVVIGSGVTPFAGQLVSLGADRVVVADHPSLHPDLSEPYVDLATQAMAPFGPTHLLAGHTPLGVEVAGRLAVRAQAGLVTACTGLGLAGGAVVAERPSDGGLARIGVTSPLAIFTLQPGHHAWPSANAERSGEVMALELPAEGLISRIQLLESMPGEQSDR
ncbi:MAG TPA: hypothetical protein V6D05_11285 [Stenomitos sp.]